MRRAARMLLLSALWWGCGSDSGVDDTELPLSDSGTNPNGDGSAFPDAGHDGAVTDPSDANTENDSAVRPPPPVDCGDGKLVDPEECDDGAHLDGDGCDYACKREPGFNCPPLGGACAPICGDGMVVAGELCDDQDLVAGNGCDQMCQVEEGWSCLGSGVPCEAARCGDGLVAGSETCDDRNDVPGDGCSASCKVESGWLCSLPGAPCTAERCGDGIRAGSEACDDGDEQSGDGCTASCDAVEPNYACPDQGGACVRTSVCGNGALTSDEECDDFNLVSGDGCSNECKREAGWLCAVAGALCTAAQCGDGIIAGAEQCEDGNANDNDGCKQCQIVAGWACEWPVNKSVCHLTVCGDGKREGDEACDDHNDVVGDGCGPTCRSEPTCQVGQACTSVCGDGIRLGAEQCDDGNVRNGDGCSSECKVEGGFTCTDVRDELPNSFPISVVYRDFIRSKADGAGGSYSRHSDFEAFSGSDATTGLVGDTLVGGKPAYTGICDDSEKPYPDPAVAPCPYKQQMTTEAKFNQWYANAPIANVMKKHVTQIEMQKTTVGGKTVYRNPTFGQQLFPLDGLGADKSWVADGKENASDNHNFGFTTEIHHWFEFKGGEVLTFSGDDDVWVFVGGKLALDLGGLHSKKDRTIRLNTNGTVDCFVGTDTTGTSCGTRTVGLAVGNVYEMALFHAERHTNQSNFDLTLAGFVAARSVCQSHCGDGVITSGELCDDGSVCDGGERAGNTCVDDAGCPGGTCKSRNDGSYGRCTADCKGFGPRCGDGVKQVNEACDKGTTANMGGYNGCTQTCQLGPYCGDSKVDSYYGERCDLGAGNTGAYDTCSPSCGLAPRCGDAVVQADQGEVCDDGLNRSTYNGCGPGCVLAPRCGDGVVQRNRLEQCDDGAANDGRYNGCKADCTRAARCGDGTLDPTQGESCDDGNFNDYDGCSASCEIERIWI